MQETAGKRSLFFYVGLSSEAASQRHTRKHTHTHTQNTILFYKQFTFTTHTRLVHRIGRYPLESNRTHAHYLYVIIISQRVFSIF